MLACQLRAFPGHKRALSCLYRVLSGWQRVPSCQHRALSGKHRNLSDWRECPLGQKKWPIGPKECHLRASTEQTWVWLNFFIRFNTASESFDLIQLMTHNSFTRLYSNQLTTQNGFLKLIQINSWLKKPAEYFDSYQLMTQRSFQNFDFNQLMTKNSGILIQIKSWLNDLNQLLILWPFLGYLSISLTFLGFH